MTVSLEEHFNSVVKEKRKREATSSDVDPELRHGSSLSANPVARGGPQGLDTLDVLKN